MYVDVIDPVLVLAVCARACMLLCVCWMDYLGRETQRSNWHQLHQMFLVAHRCADRLCKIESRCQGSTANSSLTTNKRLLPRSQFSLEIRIIAGPDRLESGLWPRLEESRFLYMLPSRILTWCVDNCLDLMYLIIYSTTCCSKVLLHKM